MPAPVKCFTCGRQLTQTLFINYQLLKEERQPRTELDKLGGIIRYDDNVNYVDFFEKNGIERYCCRAQITTSVTNLEEKIS